MNSEYFEYIHPLHFGFFVEAAKFHRCHILVRKTGSMSLQWIGKPGYTGKRGDMKAKTADQVVPGYDVAGLVCSPYLLPMAFSGGRLGKAIDEWSKCRHLITESGDSSGFDDRRQPTRCLTPYLLQTNTRHRHYGCVALIECGLLIPRYIHGDYDLYAIIPEGQAFDANRLDVKPRTLGSSMAPSQLGLKTLVGFSTPNLEGPLSFNVANFINTRIASQSPDLLGALMVNHGEQINLGSKGQTYETVLAVMPRQENGEWAKILRTQAEHEAFYSKA